MLNAVALRLTFKVSQQQLINFWMKFSQIHQIAVSGNKFEKHHDVVSHENNPVCDGKSITPLQRILSSCTSVINLFPTYSIIKFL